MEHYHRLEKLEPILKKLAAVEPVRIVALGDSNTDNTAFTAGAKQWLELTHTKLKQHYKNLKVLALNAGVSGDSVQEALVRFETDVALLHPHLTFVCLGSNDGNRLTDEAFLKGMNEILDRLKALSSLPVLISPIPIWERSKGYNRIWPDDEKLRAKQLVLRDIAENRKEVFIDMYQLWHGLAAKGKLDLHDHMTDEVHMNALGHQLFHRLLLPAFGISES